MPRQMTKVIYKPDTQSTDEYIVMVNINEYNKWKEGDTSIPLTEVLDSFEVFHSGQGSQGLLGKASNQQLDTVFGSHKDIDVCTQILKEGRAQSTDGIKGSTWGGTNDTKGSGIVDTKGKGMHGI